MSSTKEILIKIKDAVQNNSLAIKDIPISDIKEAVSTEFSILSGNNSPLFNELIAYCQNIPSEYSDKDASLEFINTMIHYCTIYNDKNINDNELPDNTDPEDQYIYYMKLANKYQNNIDQYYLCLENAYYHCKDITIKNQIHMQLDELRNNKSLNVKPVSIVIVSYNNIYLMQKCIESIRNTCFSDSYELVVVDNASSDGVTEWLEMQKDILLVKNNKNVGFPTGCNIGIKHAQKNNDIFLLNNDTRLTPNSLFWLRMGLYQDTETGATGAISNYIGNVQYVDLFYTSIGDYQKFGYVNNIDMTRPYEECMFLCGFALLIKRSALDKTTFLSEELSPGYYEDDDICLQLKQLNYKLYTCHNSFIYHAGSQSFGKLPSQQLLDINIRNKNYMYSKWHFNVSQNKVSDIIFNTIVPSKNKLVILEINAHCGANYAHIKYICNKLEYIGLECNKIYKPFAITNAPIYDVDWKKFNYGNYPNTFDYIIFNDTNNYTEKEIDKFINISKKCLKQNGQYIWINYDDC